MRRVWVLAAVLAFARAATADPCRATVTFAPGASSLNATSKRSLDPVRDQLRDHRDLRVQIVAGSAAISTKRAEAAKWYLVDGGVENDRIDTATSATGTAPDDVQIAVVGTSCEVPTATTPRPAKDSMVSDASDLANLLAGGEPTPSPRPVAAPTPAPHPVQPPAATTGIHIGNDDVGFRGDSPLHAQAVYSGLPLALAALRGTTAQHHEDDLAREALATQPEPTQKGQFRLDPREMRELSRCYRKALALDPSTSNQVDLSFAIDKKGRVVQPVAVSDSGELDACLNAAMARWKFPGKSRKDRIWLSVVLAPR